MNPEQATIDNTQDPAHSSTAGNNKKARWGAYFPESLIRAYDDAEREHLLSMGETASEARVCLENLGSFIVPYSITIALISNLPDEYQTILSISALLSATGVYFHQTLEQRQDEPFAGAKKVAAAASTLCMVPFVSMTTVGHKAAAMLHRYMGAKPTTQTTAENSNPSQDDDSVMRLRKGL